MLQRETSVSTHAPNGVPIRAKGLGALALLLAALAGCGQKGPLSLPKPLPTAPATAASSPAR